MESTSSLSNHTILPQPIIHPEEHHKQDSFCYSRSVYRQGKEFKAVKVYTINEESNHLILQNIPIIDLRDELKQLCQRFGTVKNLKLVSPSDYPATEKFTSVYYVQYTTLREARYAKIKLDNRAFFGSVIHVCYAPELEKVEETREKLGARRRYVQSYFSKNKKNKWNEKFRK